LSLKALIFDVDGTLAETEELHRWAFNEVFRKQGLNWEWDQSLYAELLKVTGGRERIRHYMQTIDSDLLAQENLGEFIAGLHQEKTDYYTQQVDQGKLALRPGVERLIREAREEGLRLAIATTTSRPNVVSLLSSTLGTESLDWFEALGTGECSPLKKPDPGVYHWVLEQMNLPANECLALEDSANGLQAGLAAGIPTVITVSSYTAKDDFSGALVVANHLGSVEQPAEMYQGDALGKDQIDIALLRHWHEQGDES